MRWEGAGCLVVGLRIEVSVDMVIAREAELEPDIPGPSALLTPTMPEMARVIRTLREMGRRQAEASRQLSESLTARPNPQAHKVKGPKGVGD